MKKNATYQVFLSMNFTRSTKFIVDIAKSEARKYGFKVEMLTPGNAAENPASAARNVLRDKSIEGLLAIIFEKSMWISNEIGMSYAYSLPIYVIYDKSIKIDEIAGIAKLVTSMNTIEIFNPDQLRSAFKQAFSVLQEKIISNRMQLSEPPSIDEPIVRLNWEYYWRLILEAHRKISMDVDSIQKGFKPTIILGISRGGAIVADILARLGEDKPLGLLEADRKTTGSEILFLEEPIKTILTKHFEDIGVNKQARILIVDDVMKSGKTLHAAVSKVSEIIKVITKIQSLMHSPLIKSLVLVKVKQKDSPPLQPNYSFLETPSDCEIILPYGLG